MTQRHHLSSDSGTVSLFTVSLAILVLGLGGLTVDMLRVYTAWRSASIAVDAAAAAGSSGIDESYYRTAGTVRLDADLAYQLAVSNLSRQTGTLEDARIDVATDGTRITVTGSRSVDLLLTPVIAPTLDIPPVTAIGVAVPAHRP